MALTRANLTSGFRVARSCAAPAGWLFAILLTSPPFENPAGAVRKTKIICTIGPATASYEMLQKLCAAGMNVVRLNMSHADHAGAAQIINWIKTLNRKIKYPIPIMLDTQGPEIRTGDVTTALDLRTGDVIDVTVRDDVDVERRVAQPDQVVERAFGRQYFQLHAVALRGVEHQLGAA